MLQNNEVNEGRAFLQRGARWRFRQVWADYISTCLSTRPIVEVCERTQLAESNLLLRHRVLCHGGMAGKIEGGRWKAKSWWLHWLLWLVVVNFPVGTCARQWGSRSLPLLPSGYILIFSSTYCLKYVATWHCAQELRGTVVLLFLSYVNSSLTSADHDRPLVSTRSIFVDHVTLLILIHLLALCGFTR